jgi:hypothetical protein
MDERASGVASNDLEHKSIAQRQSLGVAISRWSSKYALIIISLLSKDAAYNPSRIISELGW